MENTEFFSPENNNSGAGDSFSVEELLNFTDTDDSLAGATDSAVESSNLSFSGGDFGYQSFAEPQFSDDLCVPSDDVAELEWLSNFVEDSFSSADLQNLNLISGTKPPTEPRPEPEQNTTQPQSDLSVATPCDSASRLSILSPYGFDKTSQCRTGLMGPIMPLHSVSDETSQWRSGPMGPNNPLHCVSDKTSQWRTKPMGPNMPSGEGLHPLPLQCVPDETSQWRTGPIGPDTPLHCVSDETSQWRTGPMGPNNPSADHPLHCVADKTQQWGAGPMGPKKSSSDHPAPQKRKREVVAGADGRRCLHCETDKTPQWRTGPMGPKTLCNACGVRYKSGRLVPEYRPVASPTFVTAKHSNSHRKVLELRRQKDAHHQFFDHGGGTVVFDGSNGDDYLIHQHIGPDFRKLI